MDDAAQRQDDFADPFEAAFARLRIRLETACASQSDWPLGAAAAMREAMEFAAGDPVAARALTTDALAAGRAGFPLYERLISYLCDLLRPGREERPEADDLPGETERALAGGIAMLVAQRLDVDSHAELPAIAGEAIQFVLTPYLGIDEARRIAAANLRRGWKEAKKRH
jgi:hypothetical protein